MRTITLKKLISLPLYRSAKAVRNWWLRCTERHFLICADVEQQRACEAQQNVAYYRKRAVLAKAAQLDL